MRNDNSAKMANIKMLEFVATKLGELCNEVVFLGGCTTALLMTDPLSPDVRHTLDVDCIVDIITLNQYHIIEQKLRELGFKQSLLEEVICRWHYDDAILDIMPTDEKILGFSNRWYKDAIKYSHLHSLTNTLSIKVVSAPYFIGTKIEAFKTRGSGDFYASSDIEDIIAVLDCRLEIVEEIKQCKINLKNYLVNSLSKIYNNQSFQSAIPGHFVHYGNLANDRIDLLEQKIMDIIGE